MADDNKKALALETYDALCATLDKKGLKFEKDDDDLSIHFVTRGDDLPIPVYVYVIADRQLIRLESPMPFKMSEEKRMEGAIATCAASYRLLNGNFDYDIMTGMIVFRATASFRDSYIGEELFMRMISFACVQIDKYNDQFLAVDKGVMSVSDFIIANKK